MIVTNKESEYISIWEIGGDRPYSFTTVDSKQHEPIEVKINDLENLSDY